MPNITSVTQWFKVIATHIRTKIGVDVVEIGSADKSLIATGNDFIMKNTRPTGKTELDGISEANLKVDGILKFHASSVCLWSAVHHLIRSGNELQFYDVTNSVFGRIWQDGDFTKFVDRHFNECLMMGNGFNEIVTSYPFLDDISSIGIAIRRWKEGFINAHYNGYYRSVDATYTVTGSDWFVEMTDLLAARIVELPSALIAVEGWTIWIKASTTGGAVVTIATEGAETIEGAANYAFPAVGGEVMLISDGTNMRLGVFR